MAQFPKETSGNPVGRPKGSKNKVTLYKLIAEESARERNADKIQAVIDLVVRQALTGDIDSQKLVWQSVMSKGSADDSAKAAEQVQITINAAPKAEPPKVEIVQVIDVTPEEITHE